MCCSAYLYICGVQEYVESMARRPGSSIQQGSFTPHILGGLQHRKRGATYQFERKSASKNSIFEGIRPIFQSLMGLKYGDCLMPQLLELTIVVSIPLGPSVRASTSY